MVSKSRIQGYGVYFEPSEKESGEIRDDCILFPYGGVIHQRSEHLCKFQLHTNYFSNSVLVDKDRIFPVGPFEINPTVKGNEAQFINHSHQPNCQVKTHFKYFTN